MEIVSRVSSTLQRLLGEIAERVAAAEGLIVRKRKFTGPSLAAMMVLGLLRHPKATFEDLAATAAELGVDVTPQAVRKRFTRALVEFLRGLFEAAAGERIVAEARSIPLLQKFTAVRIGDSSTIALPDDLAAEFPGCGGPSGSGKAALKLQVEMDQKDGGLKVVLEAGRDSDAKSVLMRTLPEAGSLTIRDLGYFSLEWFRLLIGVGAFFVWRLQPKTRVFERDGTPLDLLRVLQREVWERPFERLVLLGSEERVACRLIALRVPAAVAERRRRKARRAAQKEGRTPTAEHLAWMSYTVFITNCEAERLSWREVVVLYRMRWQIELLFKLWKSHNLLACEGSGESSVVRMAKLMARLTGVLLQHAMLLTSVWTDGCHSLWKAAVVLRRHLVLLTSALGDVERVCAALLRVSQLIDRPARIKRRKKRPGTFQLLRNPELLEYTF